MVAVHPADPDAEFPLILGGGAVPFRRDNQGGHWRDWVRRASEAAITDAGLEIGDLDAVVLASESDFFSLQVNPGPVVLDDLGLTGRPVLRVEAGGGSGAAALRAGIQQITSGDAGIVLVAGFEATASSLAPDAVQLIYGLSFDARTDGMAGATSAALYALSIKLHMAAYGTTAEQLAAVSVKNHGNAVGNPLAHLPMSISVEDVLASPMVSTPYRRLDCSPLSDGAAALVLAAPGRAPKASRPRARVIGWGSATDHARLGDRSEPHRFAAKAAAARDAYAMAGIADPGRGIDVAELYDAFTGAEIQAMEAHGFAPPGHAAPAMAEGAFGPDGRLPVNLSGGLIGQGAAPGATGILQAVTMERLLTGRMAQEREFRTGVIDAHGGICTSSFTHIIRRVEP
jgi:acetyl-CoA C-acetyltransferase